MGKFDKYAGIIKFEIDGIELELNPTLEDKRKIMSYSRKVDDKGNIDNLYNVFKDIVKRAYPEEEETNLDAFLLRNDETLMMKLSEAFGWMKEEDFRKTKENLMKA